MVGAVLVVALFTAGPLGSLPRPEGAAGAVGEGTVAATVVVAPGDTVWDLVAGHAPAGESRHSYVARTLAFNGLDSARVQPGTVLRLPGN